MKPHLHLQEVGLKEPLIHADWAVIERGVGEVDAKRFTLVKRLCRFD